MKIIDLLNKIANGEIPKKIKYDGTIYEYDNYKGDEGYVDKTQEPYKWFENEIVCDVKQYLDDTVEILEEEKKIPEKLNIEDDGNTITLYGEKENEWTILDNVDVIICNKINSIIDYLKSKGE